MTTGQSVAQGLSLGRAQAGTSGRFLVCGAEPVPIAITDATGRALAANRSRFANLCFALGKVSALSGQNKAPREGLQNPVERSDVAIAMTKQPHADLA